MAIVVNGGHVLRAIDFYDKEHYFIIGGNQVWENEPSPDAPNITDFKLRDVIGLKKVDNTYLVVPDNDRGTIVFRDQKYRVVVRDIRTVVGAGGIALGGTSFLVDSLEGMREGSKLRINNLYEGLIVSVVGNTITLDTPAPEIIDSGSLVEGGALIEGAKYIYVEGHLRYNEFPLIVYRQIGLCTGVVPKDNRNSDILLSDKYSESGENEYESLGVLEILDNRAPITRDIDMRELIGMIIEM